MNEIGVDLYRLRQNIRRLDELYAAACAEIEALADFAASADIFWDGEANTAFMMVLGEDLAAISAFMVRIRRAVSACNRAFSLYTQCEREVGNMIGELSR